MQKYAGKVGNSAHKMKQLSNKLLISLEVIIEFKVKINCLRITWTSPVLLRHLTRFWYILKDNDWDIHTMKNKNLSHFKENFY